MKTLYLTCLVFLILSVCYIKINKGSFRINDERIGFFLLHGGYRAWWMRYSEGRTWNNEGKQVNLWCFPKFEHCDVRKLLEDKNE